jgi:hypothetical protein
LLREIAYQRVVNSRLTPGRARLANAGSDAAHRAFMANPGLPRHPYVFCLAGLYKLQQ